MKLKHYQEKVLKELKDYLGALSDAKKEFEEIAELKPHLAKHKATSAAHLRLKAAELRNT